MYRLADGLSGADIQGMSLDPQAQDPSGFQNPREVVSEPGTDEQDPATPGGPSPFNGAEPVGSPVAADPLWRDPAEEKKPPYTPLPYTGPGPGVDTTTLHNARRAPMEEAMTDLWVEASRDVEAELERERMVRAKTAASNLWPFLSSARSEREFGHKLALCEPQLASLFPDDEFRDKVTASLREDYLVVTGAVQVEELWEQLDKTAAVVVEPSPLTAMAQGYDWLHFEAASEPEEEPNGGGTSGAQTNPAYDNQEPERGPLTGPSETFAQGGVGPDPWNPMNEQYPMKPTAWVVQPGTEWVDRPMQFGKQSTAVGHPDHPGHYQGEGVETGPAGSKNEEYFSGGPEGVAGTQQTGFPADQTLPEPDERVDMFGAVPPQLPQPAPAAAPYSNTAARQGSRYLAEKDNHGACAHCNSPVYREGDEWKHLGGNPGHGVRLHEDHPWVVGQQANRVLAANSLSPASYTFAAREGGAVTITQDPRRRITLRWVLGEASSSDLGTGSDGGGADPGGDVGAPGAPQSMEPGGAGAVAGPPLTIPNQGAQTNPFADGGAPPQQQMPMVATRTALVRERPTSENPSGVPDEYVERTWNAAAEQHPLQQAEQRGVNTPQRPGEAIPTRSSEPDQAPEDEDDEEERR